MNHTHKDATHSNTNFQIDKEIGQEFGGLDPPRHSSLYRKVRTQIRKTSCFENVPRILVGISGGVDSAMLLHLLAEYRDRDRGPEITAFHVNHRQRGKESSRDEEVAKNLARSYSADFFSTSLKGVKSGMSEDSLRNLRREALEQFAKDKKIQRIVLGHHADDQVETFLFRLIRGSDIEGLSGMKFFQKPYVRPLLFSHRHEIEREAERCNMMYVHDSSNFVNASSRNFIRNVLIPLIQSKLDPQVVEHIFDASQTCAEIQPYLENEALKMIEKIQIEPHNYPIDKMRNIEPVLRKKMIQLMFSYIIKDKGKLLRDQAEMIDHWIDSTHSPKYLKLSQGIRVEKTKGVLRFLKS